MERSKLLTQARDLQAQLDKFGADTNSNDSFRHNAEIEIAELRRQAADHALERGKISAEMARVRAENSVMASENKELLFLTKGLPPPPKVEPAALPAPQQDAFYLAEQWVLYHAGMPSNHSSLTYMGRVQVNFNSFVDSFASLAEANKLDRERI